MAFPKYKTRVTFLCCTQNLENVLDTCKVADICLFVTNGADGEEGAISPQADLLLTALRNQGLPTSTATFDECITTCCQCQIDRCTR